MASVKSLGMHPPIGVDGLPVEGSYNWDVFTDDDGEDELLTIGNCVIWKRGGVFRKSFNLEIEQDEPILQALLTYFPTTDIDKQPGTKTTGTLDQSGVPRPKTSKNESSLAKALIVFLKTQAHIFFLSGTSHIVHMPFEVESACVAPVGVIIQRKPRTHNLAPMGLKFPRVPPKSFLAAQLSPPQARQQSQTTSFSVEGLGLPPKTLPLRLSTTMEHMFEAPFETNDSHWPRLVCLTDPLLELGLVVSHSAAATDAGRPKSAAHEGFLDLSEEILHVETIDGGLVLAVTANRETNLYTIWQLTHIHNEDLFTKHQKKRKSSISRRRSSMQPRVSSGATTPVAPSFRESLGPAPLPQKKTRKSDKSKSDDIAVAFSAETEGDKAKRQSRRVSSLLARADLSASHERTTFADQSMPSNNAEHRRMTGAHRARQSNGPSNLHLSGTYSMSNLGSHREAQDLLEELRAGGDFEGFHDMGLDDHNFDGLAREMLLTKIHSVAIDNTNVRYSLSTQPARSQYRVFVVKGPPFTTDEMGRKQLLIGIQDPLDKRLQLLPVSVERIGKSHPPKNVPWFSTSSALSCYKVTPGILRRASNVIDSCKVADGEQAMLLILSERSESQRELTVQAPWSAMTVLNLPLLYADNLGSLDYTGTHVNRATKGRRSVGSNLSATDIAKIRHSRSSGVVDLADKEGKIHRVQIQLQPANPQVRKILQVCRSVLPIDTSEKMQAGWWHIMKWTAEQSIDTADREWSSLVVEIFVLFLALAPTATDSHSLAPTTVSKQSRSLDPSSGTYAKMLSMIAPPASPCPDWMQSHPWRWVLNEATTAVPAKLSSMGHEDFMTTHVQLAKSYMRSPFGQNALGLSGGHLPTALNQSPEDRNLAAWAVVSALHLLAEEDKLNVMSPECASPGRADLKLILCQIGRWLGWHEFVALHELDTQAELNPSNDCGK